MQSRTWIIYLFLLTLFTLKTEAQTTKDTVAAKFTLSECVKYAITNQPLLKQSQIDEDITKRNIRIALSGWYPQAEIDANLQHNFKLPLAYYPNLADLNGPEVPIAIGLFNTSEGTLSLNQNIFTTDLLFAAKTSHLLKKQASQNTENTRINTIVEVTKSFYDVLLTEKQVIVLKEDIQRLERNYKDAYNLYKSGITDKIDYQRTDISLSNAKAQKRTIEESVKAKYSLLKQLIGFPSDKKMTITYDSVTYEKEILIDTTEILNYDKRIEYQLLVSEMNLQNAEVGYYKWSFLPKLSAFYDYNLVYQNNNFPDLYNQDFPNSYLGLKLTLPLFQGTSRLQNISKAKLQYKRLNLGMDYLKSELSTEFTQSLAEYKSNLNELKVAKKNVALALDIFNTVKLQYDKGIKAYLEVIVSETDLRTAELNYLNILFRVLSSKIDFERALGNVK